MALINPSLSDLTTDDLSDDQNCGGTPSDDPNLRDECQKGVKYLVDNSQKMLKLPSQYVLSLPKNPLTVSRASIPTIDLSGLAGAVQNRRYIIQSMSTACSEWGFLRALQWPFPVLQVSNSMLPVM